MGAPATGQVVLVPFPFTDLSRTKLRPAVLLADSGRGDWILCQVTSNRYADTRAVELTAADFAAGSLSVVSYARPTKLFTAHQRLFASELGSLRHESFNQIIDAVIKMFRP